MPSSSLLDAKMTSSREKALSLPPPFDKTPILDAYLSAVDDSSIGNPPNDTVPRRVSILSLPDEVSPSRIAQRKSSLPTNSLRPQPASIAAPPSAPSRIHHQRKSSLPTNSFKPQTASDLASSRSSKSSTLASDDLVPLSSVPLSKTSVPHPKPSFQLGLFGRKTLKRRTSIAGAQDTPTKLSALGIKSTDREGAICYRPASSTIWRRRTCFLVGSRLIIMKKPEDSKQWYLDTEIRLLPDTLIVPYDQGPLHSFILHQGGSARESDPVRLYFASSSQLDMMLWIADIVKASNGLPIRERRTLLPIQPDLTPEDESFANDSMLVSPKGPNISAPLYGVTVNNAAVNNSFAYPSYGGDEADETFERILFS